MSTHPIYPVILSCIRFRLLYFSSPSRFQQYYEFIFCLILFLAFVLSFFFLCVCVGGRRGRRIVCDSFKFAVQHKAHLNRPKNKQTRETTVSGKVFNRSTVLLSHIHRFLCPHHVNDGVFRLAHRFRKEAA